MSGRRLLAALIATAVALAGCAGTPVSQVPSAAGGASATTAATATPWPTPELREEEVALQASDGIVLIATLRGEGPTGVVLAHMNGGQASDWDPLTDALVDAGYRVLALNLRGNGRSQPPMESASLPLDVEAGAQYLRDAGADRVVLAGASMGGTTVLAAAVAAQPAAVVVMAAPRVFEGLELTENELAQLTMPKLFITAEHDPLRDSFDEIVAMAAPPTEEAIYPGIEHGTRLFGGSHAAEVIGAIVAFIEAEAAV
jgi:pimeloyl-ACP methyl ester carboxylesterase